jgi:hypothetical protein
MASRFLFAHYKSNGLSKITGAHASQQQSTDARRPQLLLTRTTRNPNHASPALV